MYYPFSPLYSLSRPSYRNQVSYIDLISQLLENEREILPNQSSQPRPSQQYEQLNSVQFPLRNECSHCLHNCPYYTQNVRAPNTSLTSTSNNSNTSNISNTIYNTLLNVLTKYVEQQLCPISPNSSSNNIPTTPTIQKVKESNSEDILEHSGLTIFDYPTLLNHIKLLNVPDTDKIKIADYAVITSRYMIDRLKNPTFQKDFYSLQNSFKGFENKIPELLKLSHEYEIFKNKYMDDLLKYIESNNISDILAKTPTSDTSLLKSFMDIYMKSQSTPSTFTTTTSTTTPCTMFTTLSTPTSTTTTTPCTMFTTLSTPTTTSTIPSTSTSSTSTTSTTSITSTTSPTSTTSGQATYLFNSLLDAFNKSASSDENEKKEAINNVSKTLTNFLADQLNVNPDVLTNLQTTLLSAPKTTNISESVQHSTTPTCNIINTPFNYESYDDLDLDSILEEYQNRSNEIQEAYITDEPDN